MATKTPKKSEGLISKAAHAITEAITGGDDDTKAPESTASEPLSPQDEKRIDEIFSPAKDTASTQIHQHRKFDKFK